METYGFKTVSLESLGGDITKLPSSVTIAIVGNNDPLVPDLIKHDVRVAFSNGIRFASTRIYAFLVCNHSNVKPHLLSIQDVKRFHNFYNSRENKIRWIDDVPPSLKKPLNKKNDEPEAKEPVKIATQKIDVITLYKRSANFTRIVREEEERTQKQRQRYYASRERNAKSLLGYSFLKREITSGAPQKKLTQKDLKTIEENKLRQEQAAVNKERAMLKEAIKGIKNKEFVEKLHVLNSLRFSTEIESIRLRALLQLHLGALKEAKPEGYWKAVTGVYRSACDLIKRGGEGVEVAEAELRRLGFNSTVDALMSIKNRCDDYDALFQMKFMPQHLIRTLDAHEDSRVPFTPDGWQRALLDVVDRDGSAVICAPTSSGKTFISYYAMERVLSRSQTGIVVYVAPSKALVNQVTAEVYARFGTKAYSNGKVLQGELTTDYSLDAFNCQVLVTVPSMAEHVVFDSQYKIEYLIIDEVHMIGDREMGLNIEKLIVGAKCPLLVLSATIGNIESFYHWVREVERQKDRECTLVSHEERFCDLKKYIETRPVIDYSNMLADEIADYYEALYTLVPDEKYRPQSFFSDAILTKAMVASYGKRLREDAKNLQVSDKVESLVSEEALVSSREIQESLGDESEESSDYEQSAKTSSSTQQKESEQSDEKEEELKRKAVKLLSKLYKRKLLPGIVFCTDREHCNKLCNIVIEELSKNDTKRSASLERINKELKRTRDTQIKGKDSWIIESMIEEKLQDAFVASRLPLAATYCDEHYRLVDAEIEKELHGLRNTPSFLCEALKRGIAVHHSGVNRAYRNVVERLFRLKHIQLVFSTETLSLGINMPCKVVMFYGDGLRLNSTTFRQMGGRAGRRGYDLMGYLVFCGVPRRKVNALMRSELPNLNCVFPFTLSNAICGNSDYLKRFRAATILKNGYELSDEGLVLSPNFRDSDAVPLPTVDALCSYQEMILQKDEIRDSSLKDLVLLLRDYDDSDVVDGKIENWRSTGHCMVRLLRGGQLIHYVNMFIEGKERYSEPLFLSIIRLFVPFIAVRTFYSGQSSYLYEYYSHCNVQRVKRECCITETDLWLGLYEFNYALECFVLFLELYEQGPTSRMMRMVYEDCLTKFKRMWA